MSEWVCPRCHSGNIKEGQHEIWLDGILSRYEFWWDCGWCGFEFSEPEEIDFYIPLTDLTVFCHQCCCAIHLQFPGDDIFLFQEYQNRPLPLVCEECSQEKSQEFWDGWHILRYGGLDEPNHFSEVKNDR
jgi:hypothetical protein